MYSHKILPMKKTNFFIVPQFYGEITVQCNPLELKLFSFAWCFVNIVRISIIVSGRMDILNGNKHRYHCRGRRSNHTNQPIHTAQLLYMCVCVCIIVTKFKSGISLGLRYLRDALSLTMCRKLIRLCKCLLNTLHSTQSYPFILPISVDNSICSFICILFGYLFNVLHCFIYAKTHELQTPDFMFLRQHSHSKGCEWQKCDYRL